MALGIPSFHLDRCTVSYSIGIQTHSAMATFRKRTLSAESDAMANDATPQQPKISDYELSREQRIRENRERMGKLGIFDLSLSLKLHNNNKTHRTTSRSSIKSKTPPTIKLSAPTRRSSRFQSHPSIIQRMILFIFALTFNSSFQIAEFDPC